MFIRNCSGFQVDSYKITLKSKWIPEEWRTILELIFQNNGDVQSSTTAAMLPLREQFIKGLKEI